MSILRLKSLIEVEIPMSAEDSKILADLKNFNPGRHHMKSEPRKNGPSWFEVSFRDVGEWKLPDDINPFSSESEDYDWQILTTESRQKLESIWKSWLSKQSWAKDVKDAEVNSEEKNWAQFIFKYK